MGGEGGSAFEGRECCKIACLYGLLLFARSFGPGGILLQTEHEGVSLLAQNLLDELFSLRPIVRQARHSGDHGLNILSVEDKSAARKIFERFGYDEKTLALRLNRANLENDCCTSAFLCGAFLSCGSIVDPAKDYHLEFVSPHLPLGRDLAALLREQGLEPKTAERKGNAIIYFKESEQIEDLLTLMGAMHQSLELMNIKVLKDLRNKANRVVNCETANIEKTVVASSAQVEAIRKIIRLRGLDYLPDDLRTLASLRLDNPEMSLRELGESLPERISRSGINRRLHKICEIAEKIPE